MMRPMRTPLEHILIDEIIRSGPMCVGRFMETVLSHPQHGYYMTRDPLGRGGDFITAPEVSQMFGEMIGAWAADVWMQMDSPARFVLLECGPGRGTLMADLMRATKNVRGFHEAAKIVLMEISPVLKEKQKQALSSFDVMWCERLGDVPRDVPLILIANEFLDALPFTQMEKKGGAWQVRAVDFIDDFYFTTQPSDIGIPAQFSGAPEGSIFEFSKEREGFVAEAAARIKAQGGAALLIDYGHSQRGLGDTFQALKGNKKIDVLDFIGDADLTSHVDFEAIVERAKAAGVSVSGPVTQGAFLKALGIDLRAAKLAKPSVKNDLHRLVDSSQMGALFKVIAFHDSKFTSAGF
jgi:NADH dehydrogenase [ubiquinone] 1 alpha subcomplex assembly factor 7